MSLDPLVGEVLPFVIVSASCFVSTIAAGLIISFVRRRRPDLRTIVAYATLSPITIPVLGGCVVAVTLLPLAPPLLLLVLTLQFNPEAVARSYVVFGTYICGCGIQLAWLSED